MVNKKTAEEIVILKEGGRILSNIIDQVIDKIKPGIEVIELNAYAEILSKKAGGVPSFKGFNGYPSAACISINHGLVHGIPKKGIRIIEGDIVSVDIGLKYKNLFTDMSKTVAVGKVPKLTKKLLKVTSQALKIGIDAARPGNTIGDIGSLIQTYVEKQNFSVVRSLVGHGVGYKVHEEPRVPNFGKPGSGLALEPGMVLALEPMVNIGRPEVITKSDGWTIVTADRSLCAHFEHTIVITKSKALILTL